MAMIASGWYAWCHSSDATNAGASELTDEQEFVADPGKFVSRRLGAMENENLLWATDFGGPCVPRQGESSAFVPISSVCLEKAIVSFVLGDESSIDLAEFASGALGKAFMVTNGDRDAEWLPTGISLSSPSKRRLYLFRRNVLGKPAIKVPVLALTYESRKPGCAGADK